MVTLLKQVSTTILRWLEFTRCVCDFFCSLSFSRLVVAGEVVFFCVVHVRVAVGTHRIFPAKPVDVRYSNGGEHVREVFVSVSVCGAKCIRVHKSYAAAAAAATATSSARTFFGRSAFNAHNSHLISACVRARVELAGGPARFENPLICWRMGDPPKRSAKILTHITEINGRRCKLQRCTGPALVHRRTGQDTCAGVCIPTKTRHMQNWKSVRLTSIRGECSLHAYVMMSECQPPDFRAETRTHAQLNVRTCLVR